MIRSVSVAPPILLSVLLSVAACAPGRKTPPPVPAPERTIIEAVPADARCRAIGSAARQDAQRAPLTIDPRQLGFPVAITCEAEGYFATSETLHPRPQPSLIEATAVGAQLSPAADHAPAAGAPGTSVVPFRITIRLRQSFFETRDDRNRFYDTLKVQRQVVWSEIMGRAQIGCEAPNIPRAGASSTSPPAICRAAYQQIDTQRSADLRQVEIDRRRATFR